VGKGFETSERDIVNFDFCFAFLKKILTSICLLPINVILNTTLYSEAKMKNVTEMY